MKLWIVAAMKGELELIAENLHSRAQGETGGCRWVSGVMGPHDIYLGVTGVGIAAACLGLGTLFSRFSAEGAVMVGSAGALPGSGLRVGDVVVAKSEQLAEMGVVIGPGMGNAAPLRQYGLMPEIELNSSLSICFQKAAKNYGCVHLCRSLTVVGVSADDTLARIRAERFKAHLENMEGYALGLAGSRFHIPTAEIRGISNHAGDRDKSRWDLDKAVTLSQKTILDVLRTMH